MDLSSKSQSDDEIDLALLAKAGEGCRTSFSSLYERCYNAIVRYSYRYLRDPELIEEIANDTMFTVWEKAAEFRGDSRVKTWVLGIAMRKCWESIRRRDRYHGKHSSDEALENIDDPTATLEHYDLGKDLRSALDKLSPDHRLCLELAYVGGYSGEEIASIVNCPLSTVKTRLHYARKYTKQFFIQAENEISDNAKIQQQQVVPARHTRNKGA